MANNKLAAGSNGPKKSAKTGRLILVNPGSRTHITKVTTKGQITVPQTDSRAP